MLFGLLLLLACGASVAAADYATYIGDARAYTVSAIAVDASGNTFATGSRSVSVSSGVAGQSADVFVSEIDRVGNVTLLATLNGTGSIQANGIAVDVSGNIYIVGQTTAADFPLRNALQTSLLRSNGGTGFLAKLSPTGAILYATYLGGSASPSLLNAVAADADGNAYVTGYTSASDYQRTPGMPAPPVSYSPATAITAAFFAKITPSGDKIVWAGGVSGSQPACGGNSCGQLFTTGVAIAVDQAGDAYIAGQTNALGLPVTPGALAGTGIGGFAMKINSSGVGLAYLTLIGSGNSAPGAASNNGVISSPRAIAVDASGNVYLAGDTDDPNFPATPGAFQSQPAFSASANSAAPDAFVAKLNPSGTALVWATFLGGKSTDIATQIAIDAANNVWVSGYTASQDFPQAPGPPGESDFLVELNASDSSLLYVGRYPVSVTETGLAIDSTGVLHLASDAGLVATFTPALTASPRIFGEGNAAGGVLFGRIAPGELISIYGAHFGVSAPVSGSFNAAGLLPSMLGGISVSIGGVTTPLLYVSDTQINAVAPMELAVGSTPALSLSLNGAPLPNFRTVVDEAIPGVFQSDGSAAAVNQDGTINSPSNPAKSGALVSIWATGVGATPAIDGQMARDAQQQCACVVHDQERNVDIAPAYAGAAPGTVAGVVQINFQVMAGLTVPLGTEYYLVIDGKQSSIFNVYVTE